MPEHGAADGFQIFNPGSPTERRRAPAHTMGLATIEAGRVQFELLVVG
jgi:predicted phosphodiesterase